MTHRSSGLPRWFCLLFVVVMLALCTVLISQILQHQALCDEIAVLQGKLETAQGRIPRQERELADYTAELPLVLAELEVVAPAAQAAEARVVELKAQRAALRETVAAQEARIAELQSQLDSLPVPDVTLQQVNEAIEVLENIPTLPQ